MGRRKKSVIPRFRDIIKNWPQSELQAELNSYYDFSKAAAHGVILMPSFRHATSANRENAKSTLAAASAAMMKAYLAAHKGKSAPGSERTQMETWFGSFDGARYASVVGICKNSLPCWALTHPRLLSRQRHQRPVG